MICRLKLSCVFALVLVTWYRGASAAPSHDEHAQPLAQAHLVIYESDRLNDPARPDEYVCVGSPDILLLPSGRLLASMELWLQTPEAGIEGGIDYPNHCKIFASDDKGLSWREISSTAVTWGSFFCLDDAVYLIGADPKSRNVTIVRSDDEGNHWTDPSILATGSHGCAAASVAILHDRVYSSFLRVVDGKQFPKYGRDRLSAQMLFIGDTAKDLTRPESWKWSNPAFPPTGAETAALSNNRQSPSSLPIGTLEGNAFIAPDNVVTVITRTIIDNQRSTGLTARFRLIDTRGNSEEPNFEFQSLHPFPGGQNKFKIIFDEVSGLYWAAVTPVPETMFDIESMKGKGFKGNAGNTRRMLALAYSLDSYNWFTAGCVAMSADPLEAFHYASLVPCGDDMLVLSRTSVGGRPYNNHDSNQITLHRVKDFRRLALDLASR